VAGPGRCLTINCETPVTKFKENILYYYRCPKCDHVSIFVTHSDWLSCGYRRCGVRFIRFGNTMDKWQYEKIWGVA